MIGLLLLIGVVIPASAATITGTVGYSAYSGGQTGIILVTASSSPTGAPAVATTQLASPGPFTLTNLPPPDSYWLFAYRDSNANGTNDSPEARTYSTNELSVSTDVSGVSLTLLDPDTDGDGIPDWWERKYGFDPFDHGMDGDLLVSAGETRYVDSVKSAVIGTNAAGATNLFLTLTNGFRANDSILIIAMQDTNQNLAQNIAGIYEVHRVLSVGSNALTLRRPLTNSFTASAGRRIQVLKIPDYRTAQIDGTLTCSSWDGTNGGILAFICVSGVTIGSSGAILADGKGYRGGIVMGPDFDGYGVAGEGTTGRPVSRATDRVQTQQGGGGAGERVGPGGGGGYGTAGTELSSYDGSANGQGAQAFGSTNLSRIFMGGGGGGSGSSASEPNPLIVNTLNYFPTGAGGAGGGIILVATRTLNGAGLISSVGLPGEDGRSGLSSFTSGAGGGAGGSIYIAGVLNGTVRSAAGGGVGGRNMADSRGRAGGVGGLGRLRVDTSGNPSFANMTPQPGYVGSLSKDAVLPVATDSDGDGISDYEEFLRGTDPTKADTDGDGLPDPWEAQYGLNPTNSADALSFPVVDGVTNKLTYLQIYQFGLDSTKLDYDNDGLKDYDEIFLHGTNPKNPDTDGDGLPDGWEVQYGLNPRVNDANESRSFDGVTNLQKYQWNQAHSNAWEWMYPNRAFSGTNTVSDYERFTGIRASWPVYDRNDRLVGVDYSSGVALAYVYDGNGNPIRQKWISRASETNGLPALFTFLNGLTNSIGSGPYDDPDGDGWTNMQEQKAGTNPNDALNKPDTAFNPGTSIATLQLPFTPTNFVMGVGQLDGLGAEEIVIGADGNPGTNTNFILLLTQSYNGWATQRVDVGPFGVTSIAVGQPTNRNPGSIYLGLRQTSGQGRIVELFQTNGAWQTNAIAISTSEAAFVLGVRGTNDLLASFSTNGLDRALFSLTFLTNGWSYSVVSTNASHRGLGTHGLIPSRIARDASIRLLDQGGIEIIGGDLESIISGFSIPSAAFSNAITGKWYFQTPDPMDWNAAQSYFSSLGGNLVTISSSNENAWVQGNFLFDKWIGYYQDAPTFPVPPYPSGWASGSSSAYQNLHGTWGYWTLDADLRGILYFGALMLANQDDGKSLWYHRPKSESHYAVGDIVGPNVYYTNRWRIPEPGMAANRITWHGLVLSSGQQRAGQMNSGSIFYAFVDDKNISTTVDSGDDFVTVEFVISGNTVFTNALVRIPITASSVAQSYGLVSVSFLPYQPEVLFTAEPDGQMFSWQAPADSGPLRRQLFTSAHLGMAWHSLCGVKMAEPGEGLVGLRVDPTNPSACSVSFWPPQQSLESPPSIPQTAPSTFILPSPNKGGALAHVSFRLRDNEGNASLPTLQFQVPGSTSWSNATISSVDGQTVGRIVALPTGSDHVLVWNAGLDLGAGFTNIVLLRARASDVTLTGDYSASTPYRVEISAGNPVANPDVASTLQQVPVDINVLANDTVGNGWTLTVTAFTQPVGGLVSANGAGTLRYAPAANFFGQDSFSYTVSDGIGGTSTTTVTVTIRAPGILRLEIPQFVLGGIAHIVMTSSDVGQRFELHYSTDLRTWTPLRTNLNTAGTMEFNHPMTNDATRLFYRAVLVRP